MGDGLFYDTLRHAMWISVEISAPILIVALLAGVVIGLFQALTSVQEMTLTFVPKLAAMLVTFWVTMSYMTETLTSFFTRELVPLMAGV